MKDRDRLLESLGLDVSDGIELDWSSMEASAKDGDEREILFNLHSLSRMAGFYRTQRNDDERRSSLSPGDKWKHLEIVESIGRGSNAEVFRARDAHLDRTVALKLIPNGAVSSDPSSSVTLEGERLAKVKHPNLVTIHGASTCGKDLGLWMEFIEGTTLHDLVRSRGPLSARETVSLGADLCGALAALHGAGLLHRDIKAQNVMREQGGRVVLMDLGSGVETADTGGGDNAGVSGTPLYMAPEVLAGDTGSRRADIYSLGVLLYYAVTGTYPVKAETLEDLRSKHAHGERALLRDVRPELPAPFVAAVDGALAPLPGDRFKSAGELEQALIASLGLVEATEKAGVQIRYPIHGHDGARSGGSGPLQASPPRS